MTRKELINSLGAWKNGVDPENRYRNYYIIDCEDKQDKYEHVIVQLSRKYNSFDFTVNEKNEVIVENFQKSALSGYISMVKFRDVLEAL